MKKNLIERKIKLEGKKNLPKNEDEKSEEDKTSLASFERRNIYPSSKKTSILKVHCLSTSFFVKAQFDIKFWTIFF